MAKTLTVQDRGARWRGAPLVAVVLAVFSLLFSAGCRRDMQDQPRYEAYEKTAFFKDSISSRPLVEGTVPRGFLREDTHLYTGKIGGSGVTTATGNNPPGGTSPDKSTGGGVSGAATINTTANASPSPQSSMPSSMTGGAGATGDVDSFPFPINQQVLERGRERYQIFCSMCHGATGGGDGMVVRRGYRQPPSYHTDQLREARVGHFFDVITNGWGSMPNYAAQIPVRDRWAIVAYIRTLQLSEQGDISDMPEAERDKLLNKSGESGGHSN
ncbi:MAG: cytochrome c [Pyrinomonadaceae bacterium]